MSASARKRANVQAANYWAEVMKFLESEDEPVYHDGQIYRIVRCPQCGRVLLGCEHDFVRHGKLRSDDKV